LLLKSGSADWLGIAETAWYQAVITFLFGALALFINFYDIGPFLFFFITRHKFGSFQIFLFRFIVISIIRVDNFYTSPAQPPILRWAA
jgi:hypothetical protein